MRYLLLLLLAGCVPLTEKSTIALVNAIKDRSSCIQIGAWGGGFSITPTPVIPGVGWHGSVWVAHAMPEHSVTMNELGCVITAEPIDPGQRLFTPGTVTTLRKNRDGSTTIEVK